MAAPDHSAAPDHTAVPDHSAAPDHIAALRTDTEAFASTLDGATLGFPVSGCPGWDLRALAGHLGFVHRWAATAVRDGAAPDLATIEAAPEDAGALAAWLVAGGAALADELAARDPDAPTWHVFRAPLVVGVWARRQAQETSVHRWDAQCALGRPEPIDAVLAADGVGEYFEVILPRKFDRDGGGPPERDGPVHVVATDADRAWWVRSAQGALEVHTVDHDEPAGPVAATLRGRAEDLQLVLFARRGPEVLTVEGDADLAAAWLALGGN